MDIPGCTVTFDIPASVIDALVARIHDSVMAAVVARLVARDAPIAAALPVEPAPPPTAEPEPAAPAELPTPAADTPPCAACEPDPSRKEKRPWALTWTPERVEVLRQEWPKATPIARIVAMLQALPGEPVPNNSAIASTAFRLGLSRPAGHPGTRKARQETPEPPPPAEIAPQAESAPQAEPAPKADAPAGETPENPPESTIHLANDARRVWTDERTAILRHHYPAGTPIAEIRAMLENAAGSALPSNDSIASYANIKLKVTRPKAAPTADPFVFVAPLTMAYEQHVAEVDAQTVRDWASANGITPRPHEMGASFLARVNAARAAVPLPPFRVIRRNAPPEPLPHPHLGGGGGKDHAKPRADAATPGATA